MGLFVTLVSAVLRARLVEAMLIALIKALKEEAERRAVLEDEIKNKMTNGVD